jgi:hypothetical protein
MKLRKTSRVSTNALFEKLTTNLKKIKDLIDLDEEEFKEKEKSNNNFYN